MIIYNNNHMIEKMQRIFVSLRTTLQTASINRCPDSILCGPKVAQTKFALLHWFELFLFKHSYSLSTLKTIVADFGDNLSPTICRQKRRLSPKSAIIVSSVDRALVSHVYNNASNDQNTSCMPSPEAYSAVYCSNNSARY